MKRAIILWDYSNFQAGLRAVAGANAPERFDMERFCDALTHGQDQVRIYLAGSSGKPGDWEQRFFNRADYKEGFYVKSYQRRIDRERHEREKQVDVFIATELVALAYENAYDIAYLISGDEDYVPAIERAIGKGKNVVAVTFGNQLSDELKRKADRVILLDAGDGQQNSLHYSKFMA